MYKFYLLSILVSISTVGVTQTRKTKIIGNLYYNLTFLYDTTKAPLQDVMILSFGQSSSMFGSDVFMTAEREIIKWIKAGRVGNMPGMKGIQDKFIFDSPEKKISRVRKFSGPDRKLHLYVMPESVQTVSWKIVEEFKKLGEYQCQKAIGKCKGRDYTVWFCPDLKFPYGPWKLSGLPGIIMEAYDNKKQVVFKFNRLEKLNSPSETFIEPLADFETVSEKDFEKMRKSYYESSSFNGPNSSMSLSLQNQSKQPVKTDKPWINNPMDLESKLPWIF